MTAGRGPEKGLPTRGRDFRVLLHSHPESLVRTGGSITVPVSLSPLTGSWRRVVSRGITENLIFRFCAGIGILRITSLTG